ncbi:helix-turn-helix transcriptional regulator [Naasia sp. SYSU D00948]|uniref:helix-turn-helix transcriptional regulator n=1 Tax=Naasia sp. SYSU D00948 TaxID=2817379 RepID=UPI001B3068CD|nr:LuxR family transcriptional regulator [Naasia sp. SYSU D00948]
MLIGRDTERAVIAALLRRAGTERGGALVVHGDAGVGKTALLDAVATDAAPGMRVLRTSGVEAESPLPFAALHRLLLPLVRRIPELPAPQSRALGQALGLEAPDTGTDTGNERFLVFLAVLTLLSEAAEQQAMLCVVDDAHWLDEASAAALLFVARRVELAPVALLFGARDGGVRRFDWGDLPDLCLGGLDEAAAAALLDQVHAGIAPAVRAELVARTGGNPLALREIPVVLTPDQAAGATPLPAHLPLTDGLERVFLDRHSRLSPAGQGFTLLTALDDSGDAHVLRRAAAIVGVAGGEAEAVVSGLVIEEGRRLQLQHPLVRSAVHSAAATVERRRMHAALAAALTEVGDADRAVWHQAEGLDLPDDGVADALDDVAVRARRQGGHEAASAAFERAAELSGDADTAARRLADAAATAWMSAEPGRTRVLAQAARARTARAELLADVDRLRAFVEMNFGSPSLAHGILARAARSMTEVGDLRRARELAMIATALAGFGHDSGASIDLSPLTADPPAEQAEACFVALLTGTDHLVHDRLGEAAAHLARAFDLADGLLHPDLLSNLGLAATHIGDDRAALRWRAIELEQGRLNASPLHTLHALTRGGLVQAAAALWDELDSAAAEALDLARATGQPNQRSLPRAQRLLVAAYRGMDGFDAEAENLEQFAGEHPAGVLDQLTADTLAWARAVRAGRAEPERALHHLERIELPALRRAAFFDLAEAADAAEDRDRLTAATADLARYAEATGAAWAAAAASHGRALLAGDDFADLFEEAISRHRESLRRFNQARTRLAYGERLRRSRRRVDSRSHLRSALTTFDDLGAAAWSERAAEELRASGETARRRETTEADATLTPQELQVARLVQQGLANRDVAARLFISPRTVDFHLRNVFAKLGIGSRGALIGIDLS